MIGTDKVNISATSSNLVLGIAGGSGIGQGGNRLVGSPNGGTQFDFSDFAGGFSLAERNETGDELVVTWRGENAERWELVF